MNGCGYYTNNFEQNLDKRGGLSDKYGCLGQFRTKFQNLRPWLSKYLPSASDFFTVKSLIFNWFK